MKKLFASICILGATVALGACTTEGEGHKDVAPYASERTAGEQVMDDSRPERVFHREQRK